MRRQTLAVDTSAIIAVAFAEVDADSFHSCLFGRKCVIGAPTVLEAHMVLSSSEIPKALVYLDALLSLGTCETVDFGEAQLALARTAFDRFGKGRHPASLNFGDCMAYAVSKFHGAPLLFKGRDFALTDIEPALLP